MRQSVASKFDFVISYSSSSNTELSGSKNRGREQRGAYMGKTIVAHHELLGAIDFPPTHGFSWPVNVYIGYAEMLRSSASVGDCIALSSGSSDCGKPYEGSNLIG